MLRKALLTIAVGAAALTLGASASKAVLVEFDFGNNPTVASPSGCTHSGTQPGAVCANTLSFNGTSAGLGTLTVNSFNGAPGGASSGFITYKPENNGFMGIPGNGLGESGLGESTSATTCTDPGPDCEIGGTASVAVGSSVPLGELDVRIGSAQQGELFNVYTASSLTGPYTLLGGSPFNPNPGGNITCPGDVCTIMLSGVNVVALQNDLSTGNVLLTSVSGNVVPAPVIGDGLFVLLAVGGVLFGGKILESLKKRNLHAV
jgi:hypothetical protein